MEQRCGHRRTGLAHTCGTAITGEPVRDAPRPRGASGRRSADGRGRAARGRSEAVQPEVLQGSARSPRWAGGGPSGGTDPPACRDDNRAMRAVRTHGPHGHQVMFARSNWTVHRIRWRGVAAPRRGLAADLGRRGRRSCPSPHEPRSRAESPEHLDASAPIDRGPTRVHHRRTRRCLLGPKCTPRGALGPGPSRRGATGRSGDTAPDHGEAWRAAHASRRPRAEGP
jgi:hypothetical protein